MNSSGTVRVGDDGFVIKRIEIPVAGAENRVAKLRELTFYLACLAFKLPDHPLPKVELIHICGGNVAYVRADLTVLCPKIVSECLNASV